MKNRFYISLFLILTALYIILTFITPTDPAILHKYSITQSQARQLTLTIVVPISAIWMTALYGMIKFRNYAYSIADTKEGKGFRKISHGISVLAFSLPLSATIVAALTYAASKRPTILPEVAVIKNYTNIVLTGIGLLLIAQGSLYLVRLLKKHHDKVRPTFNLFGVIVLACLYTWLIINRPFKSNGASVYFLPDWIILLTIAIPYLYIWCSGMLAVYQLFIYKKNIRGTVYIKSLDYLAKGVATIIFLSIMTQLLVTLTGRLNRLNLTPILLIVYVLVALNALGYGLIARGATKLKQIEEV